MADLAMFAHHLRVDPRVMSEVIVQAPWVLAERAWRHLSRLPDTLLEAWATLSTGHIVIALEPSRYEPGWVMWRDMQARAVVFVHARDVLEPSLSFWRPVGEWVDHWLGSGAALNGTRFSEGISLAGAPPLLIEAARRWQRVVELGYLAEWLNTSDSSALFAEGLAWMMIDQQRLSVADPHAAKWFRSTVLDEGFWRKVAPALKE